jgi:hypothetical protein
VEAVMSQPSTPIVIPSQPARLQIGDREIPLPTQPLSYVSQNRRQVELLTGDRDCFILMPLPRSAWPVWLFGIMLAVPVGLCWVFGGMALLAGRWWLALFFLLVSILPLGIAVLIARDALYGKGPQRFAFDRRKGELTICRRRGLRKEYEPEAIRRLSDIAAIQLLYSGYHSLVHTWDSGGSGGTMSEQFYTYEMNLVFWDAQQPRMHLCTHSDWEWMREMGQKLAQFLRVPVVDQLCQGT